MNQKLYVGLMIGVLLLSFFVIGPFVNHYLVDQHMPYLIIDQSLEAKAREDCDCGNVPSIPVEMTTSDGVTDNGENLIKLPVAKVPTEYLPYVHYPPTWEKWWNIYNPNNQWGIYFSWGFTILVILGALGVVYYFYRQWKRKKFKWQSTEDD